MRRALLATLAVAALGAGAVPAFSADSGTLTVTIVVEPVAPCVIVGVDRIDFGGLPFSDPALEITPLHTASPTVPVASCSDFPTWLMIPATLPRAREGVWRPVTNHGVNTCKEEGLNFFHLRATSPELGRADIATSYSGDEAIGFFPDPLPAGMETELTFGIQMPCRGSAGAGETLSMTLTILVTVT